MIGASNTKRAPYQEPMLKPRPRARESLADLTSELGTLLKRFVDAGAIVSGDYEAQEEPDTSPVIPIGWQRWRIAGREIKVRIELPPSPGGRGAA